MALGILSTGWVSLTRVHFTEQINSRYRNFELMSPKYSVVNGNFDKLSQTKTRVIEGIRINQTRV